MCGKHKKGLLLIMARSKFSYKKATDIARGREEAGFNCDDNEDCWDEIYDDNEIENRRLKFRRSTKAVKTISMDDK